MRRVDWPDEPGWWWHIQPDGKCNVPLQFMQWEDTIELASGMSRKLYYNSQFEGPISKPAQRFEMIGQLWKIVPEVDAKSGFEWWQLEFTCNEMPIPIDMSGKEFRIFLEELCEE